VLPSGGEAAAHGPRCERNLRDLRDAAKIEQIVVKEIRTKWGKFPELVTQPVARCSLVRLSAMSTA
jgi:hypothetical protein